MTSASKPAQPFIAQQQAELREGLPFSDPAGLRGCGARADRAPGAERRHR
ncbi:MULTISPECIES: hypothetical protein [Streptomyces]|uniref:Uncharacterized protein n=1 Tax=Streptomyces lienomycini TaxID=284035 RepID=A0ABV9X770_9ACTN|nr:MULTISPECIES: hypothetical protein [Streptomyces]